MHDLEIIRELWEVINQRAAHPSEASYVSRILTHEKGIDKALEKVGEESTEFILAAKSRIRDRTASEGADLLFHLLVALRAADVDLSDVLDELAARRKR
ncbi:MAG: phosphoribosyl-ATP diphosphatase [Methanomicrobiaceae archaeon]|uniref:phosphoribosyl-ATP diphosphatase n=1 Tax=hydrocarbon metagenome TaxID=938273 RepID=A0A0W8FKB9_9ZZZZ|nr:phosphoribosyl-ATP diphosphatase [Methanomicrobiaceae archaeon]MDD5418380.1 phosphoribosyl-ATP diphosphatase [Methanomicrobiaceae archaeon]